MSQLLDSFGLEKHMPQWNKKIWVSKFVFDPNRKKTNDAAQGKNGKYGILLPTVKDLLH